MSVYKTYCEFEFSIDYDYQPEEKQILYPNEDAYPGCSAEITLNAIEIAGFDILSHIGEEYQERLKAEIMESENQPPEER